MPTGMSWGCGLLIAGPIRPISVTSTSSPTTTGWTYASANALEFLIRRILQLENSSRQDERCCPLLSAAPTRHRLAGRSHSRANEILDQRGIADRFLLTTWFGPPSRDARPDP